MRHDDHPPVVTPFWLLTWLLSVLIVGVTASLLLYGNEIGQPGSLARLLPILLVGEMIIYLVVLVVPGERVVPPGRAFLGVGAGLVLRAALAFLSASASRLMDPAFGQTELMGLYYARYWPAALVQILLVLLYLWLIRGALETKKLKPFARQARQQQWEMTVEEDLKASERRRQRLISVLMDPAEDSRLKAASGGPAGSEPSPTTCEADPAPPLSPPAVPVTFDPQPTGSAATADDTADNDNRATDTAFDAAAASARWSGAADDEDEAQGGPADQRPETLTPTDEAVTAEAPASGSDEVRLTEPEPAVPTAPPATSDSVGVTDTTAATPASPAMSAPSLSPPVTSVPAPPPMPAGPAEPPATATPPASPSLTADRPAYFGGEWDQTVPRTDDKPTEGGDTSTFEAVTEADSKPSESGGPWQPRDAGEADEAPSAEAERGAASLTTDDAATGPGQGEAVTGETVAVAPTTEAQADLQQVEGETAAPGSDEAESSLTGGDDLIGGDDLNGSDLAQANYDEGGAAGGDQLPTEADPARLPDSKPAGGPEAATKPITSPGLTIRPLADSDERKVSGYETSLSLDFEDDTETDTTVSDTDPAAATVADQAAVRGAAMDATGDLQPATASPVPPVEAAEQTRLEPAAEATAAAKLTVGEAEVSAWHQPLIEAWQATQAGPASGCLQVAAPADRPPVGVWAESPPVATALIEQLPAAVASWAELLAVAQGGHLDTALIPADRNLLGLKAMAGATGQACLLLTLPVQTTLGAANLSLRQLTGAVSGLALPTAGWWGEQPATALTSPTAPLSAAATAAMQAAAGLGAYEGEQGIVLVPTGRGDEGVLAAAAEAAWGATVRLLAAADPGQPERLMLLGSEGGVVVGPLGKGLLVALIAATAAEVAGAAVQLRKLRTALPAAEV